MIMEHVLKSKGYEKVSIGEAEWIIINTCAVKQQTENKIKHRFKELEEAYGADQKRQIIIAGCFPYVSSQYIDIVKEYIPSFAAIIGLDNIHQLPTIFQKVQQKEKGVILPSKEKIDKSQFVLELPPGKLTGIVPISEGCLGRCTYCCVKNARGNLFCYDPKNIVRNTKHQLSQGIKQIYLTSQDCSIYEYNGFSLEDLITKISNLDYEFFLRLGMVNPRFLIDHLDQLLSIFKLENVYQFLHIPIQSASDNVLKKMRRPYLKSDIVDKIAILREKLPNLTISTDIICGFPSETEYDFYKTINFIKWLRPEILNISKYTMRPDTLAKNMEQIDSRVIKERSIRLSRVYWMLIEGMNEKWVGWRGKALLLHRTKKSGQIFGRNYAYKNIFLTNEKLRVGSFVKVEITKVEGYNLYAKSI